MTRVDRIWLLAWAAAAITIAGYIVGSILLHDPPHLLADRIYLMGLALAATFHGALGAMFFVGIPLRLAQNLLIKERRFSYRWETVALIIAFASLCFATYGMIVYPPEG
ncbi:hypothetical protein SAMN05444166_8474 [Singulisphaera sp. GP187]|uniref:hypothetical protein n=1 Tax=Singulisphaera sp. GP187 TaxID=1882752 RepID=UPI00092B1D93|nr:hypothetical protein [Singulisphaera sp. GP187]SIO67946.1 hypothetical protein SAMN05444166_8474 [Singulisphaera sp. GP187]